MWNDATVDFHKCGITQLLSSTKVNLHKCGITQMSSSTDVKLQRCDIAELWSSTNVDFQKCEIPQLSIYVKDPSKLFGYLRLAYEKDIQYDEFLPSEESDGDTNKAVKVPGCSTTTTQTTAKGPTGKTATLLTQSLTPRLLVAALSTTKPTTTPLSTPRIRTMKLVPLTAVRSAKAPSASSSPKIPPKVVKASSAKGTLAKEFHCASTLGVVFNTSKA